jgi:nitronate monooxygenase
MNSIEKVIEEPASPNRLMTLLGISHPIIMAPMFLVSNDLMASEAINNGITAAIPSLNYRSGDALREAIRTVRKNSNGPLGINLIVNKSNIKLTEHLAICLEEKVDYLITSLGNPKEVIRQCKAKGILVFCDVTDLAFAKKVEDLGADAIIAVNAEAGGHAGPYRLEKLIPELKLNCKVPIISAGGVGNGEELKRVLDLGADGVSVGSVFIASQEASVSQEYKEAVVNYGAKDIVMTTKLSGTPCTVINTPYVKKIGTHQNLLERLLNKHRGLKKLVKMLTFYRGMKQLQKAAFSATYKTVWCAGPSIEHVYEIRTVAAIVKELTLHIKPQ